MKKLVVVALTFLLTSCSTTPKWVKTDNWNFVVVDRDGNVRNQLKTKMLPDGVLVYLEAGEKIKEL